MNFQKWLTPSFPTSHLKMVIDLCTPMTPLELEDKRGI